MEPNVKVQFLRSRLEAVFPKILVRQHRAVRRLEQEATGAVADVAREHLGERVAKVNLSKAGLCFRRLDSALESTLLLDCQDCAIRIDVLPNF